MPEKTMPASVQEVYDELWDDVSTVHFRYQLYVELFGTQESVDLLNRFAPALFEQLFDVMLDHVLLRLAHLTDPARVPSNQKKVNQSLFLLMEVIEQNSPGLTGTIDLQAAMDDLKEFCEGMRELRNRLLGHRDWGRRAEPLPSVSRRQIKEALEKVGRIMNTVSMHYRDIEVRFDNNFEMGTGEELIQHLGDLARRLDIEEEQWRR
jgi:hypothetical protein